MRPIGNDQESFQPEKIVGKLREVEVLHGQGMSMEDAIRELGISAATFCLCGPLSDWKRFRVKRALTDLE